MEFLGLECWIQFDFEISKMTLQIDERFSFCFLVNFACKYSINKTLFSSNFSFLYLSYFWQSWESALTWTNENNYLDPF